LPRDNDKYDFFVSYARADNRPAKLGEAGWITRFVEELLAEHGKFSGGRKLTPYFDTHVIHTGADWQTHIAHGLAASRLFLAFVSPQYFASKWCCKEWRTWIDLEIAKHILSDGVAPIYIVEVPGLVGKNQLANTRLRQRSPNSASCPCRTGVPRHGSASRETASPPAVQRCPALLQRGTGGAAPC